MAGRQSETNVWRQILLDLSPLGFRLFRNQRYKGPIVAGGKLTGAFADAGVGGDGGADLIGIRTITVGLEHVGLRLGVFCAIETKIKTGRASEDQKRFLEGVRAAGGIGIVARSVEDALEQLR